MILKLSDKIGHVQGAMVVDPQALKTDYHKTGMKAVWPPIATSEIVSRIKEAHR